MSTEHKILRKRLCGRDVRGIQCGVGTRMAELGGQSRRISWVPRSSARLDPTRPHPRPSPVGASLEPRELFGDFVLLVVNRRQECTEKDEAQRLRQ